MRPALEDLDLGPSSSPSLPRGFRWEDSHRRVRAVFNDVAVADSRRVKLFQESGRLPVFYFPLDDIRQDVWEQSATVTESPLKGTASYWTIRVGNRVAEDAAWTYANPPADGPPLGDYAAFYWNKMDAWFEEEQQVFGHARDPYKRIDVLPSAQHVRIVLGGETVADTRRAQLLLETGLLTRYYIPADDVRMDLLAPSPTLSHCPYKGQASYWSARIGDRVYEDVAWSYRTPLPESAGVANLLCFYNERVDAVYVDDTAVETPATIWSQ